MNSRQGVLGVKRIVQGEGEAMTLKATKRMNLLRMGDDASLDIAANKIESLQSLTLQR